MPVALSAERGIVVPHRELFLPHANELGSDIYHARCLDLFIELYGQNSRIVKTKELDSRFPLAHLGHVVRPDAVLIQEDKLTGIGEFQFGSNRFRRKLWGFRNLLRIFKETPELLRDSDEITEIPGEDEITVYFFSRIEPDDFERNRGEISKGAPPFKIDYRQVKEGD